MKTLCTAMLCGILCISKLQAAAAPEQTFNTTSLTEQFSNPEKHYSITYPASWLKGDVPGLDFVLFAPSTGANSKAHASMNIVSDKVGEGITLEQFYSESVSNLSTALKDVSIEKTGSENINGTQAKWLLYTHVMQNIKFRVLQYFLVKNGIAYLLTFSATADSFSNYKGDFESMAESFLVQTQLIPPKS